jgi:hypothetical protein
VQDVYNGLGQLTGEYQSHSGAVVQGTTPEVQYAYTEMSGGQNNSRLVSMTYPSGYQLNYNYNSGLDSNISRLSSISDSIGVLESYKYLGLGTVVERDHPQTNVNQTYISQNGQTGDAGDQYTGLDRFAAWSIRIGSTPRRGNRRIISSTAMTKLATCCTSRLDLLAGGLMCPGPRGLGGIAARIKVPGLLKAPKIYPADFMGPIEEGAIRVEDLFGQRLELPEFDPTFDPTSRVKPPDPTWRLSSIHTAQQWAKQDGKSRLDVATDHRGYTKRPALLCSEQHQPC